MKHYEGLFIINPSVSEERKKEIIQDVESLIKQFKGAVEKIEDWGIRKLQYPVKGKKEAPFYLIYFTVSPEAMLELRKNWQLKEDILRFSLFNKVAEMSGGGENGQSK